MVGSAVQTKAWMFKEIPSFDNIWATEFDQSNVFQLVQFEEIFIDHIYIQYIVLDILAWRYKERKVEKYEMKEK